MAFAITKLYWLRIVFNDLHVSLSIALALRFDNLSALSLASNLVFYTRNKHIEVDYHFVREKVTWKDIFLQHIFTTDQLAYLFTKSLTSAQFQLLRDKLIIHELPINLRGPGMLS